MKRRNFLKNLLVTVGASVWGKRTLFSQSASTSFLPGGKTILSERLQAVTPNANWRLTESIKINFRTFHCQGMVKIGREFWVTSVEMDNSSSSNSDRSIGKGHLFRMDNKGNLLEDIAIGEGAIYHPSGIDFDGKHIWIAVAEYRPDSQSIIYRFDPLSGHLREMFRWKDHIGGILRDPETNMLHGISWGSRRCYSWPLKGLSKMQTAGSTMDMARRNGSFYIDYQDNQYIGGQQVVYTGLSSYKTPEGGRLTIGGIEVVDLQSGFAVHQVPIELRSPATGNVITQNPSWFEVTDLGLKAYFIPDDNDSTIFVYEC